MYYSRHNYASNDEYVLKAPYIMYDRNRVFLEHVEASSNPDKHIIRFMYIHVSDNGDFIIKPLVLQGSAEFNEEFVSYDGITETNSNHLLPLIINDKIKSHITLREIISDLESIASQYTNQIVPNTLNLNINLREDDSKRTIFSMLKYDAMNKQISSKSLGKLQEIIGRIGYIPVINFALSTDNKKCEIIMNLESVLIINRMLLKCHVESNYHDEGVKDKYGAHLNVNN